MRSDLVFAAEHRLPNRYMLCRVLATATRRVHKPATRIEDTTDAMLRGIANSRQGGLELNSTSIMQAEEAAPQSVHSGTTLKRR